MLRLSTTSRAVGALSTTFDANLGVDTHTFFSGFLNGGTRIAGSSFFFDPSAGNLLLDVTVHSQTTGPGGFDTDASGTQMSRVFQSSAGAGDIGSDSRGLVTTFETSLTGNGAEVVPEPTSLLLLLTGLAGVGFAARRRREENA